MFDILLLPIIIIIILGVVMAIIGNLAYWGSSSTIADATGHSLLSGLVISAAISSSDSITLFLVSIFIACSLSYVYQKSGKMRDASLVIVSQMFISFSIVIAYVFNIYNSTYYFFGNILLVSWPDIIYSIFVLIVVLSAFIFGYKKIILYIINNDISQSNGVSSNRMDLYYTIMLTISIAAGIKIFGILLTTGLFIIPAIISNRLFRFNVIHTIILSYFLILSFFFVGLLVSYIYNIPVSAATSCVMIVFFMVGTLVKYLLRVK